jgi:hypothetical protein
MNVAVILLAVAVVIILILGYQLRTAIIQRDLATAGYRDLVVNNRVCEGRRQHQLTLDLPGLSSVAIDYKYANEPSQSLKFNFPPDHVVRPIIISRVRQHENTAQPIDVGGMVGNFIKA